ncbi:hypothetical protein PYW08_013908 [Mythimna loreyi]|uniref:Uncharacterized protein n=1 Tax=Mythimna loreyi TaxID=667449 RepID=A0ACC2R8G5_9NEOP|nr:hypothetical protein PYW08_013908 [Mythimna loreyi]
MAENRAVLYAFWLSSCSWRVRAALHLKRIPFEERPVDIVKENQQLTDEYRSINPNQKVPALLIDNETLVESMAIVQYLEDTRPEPALTPKSPLQKARMRELCEIVVSGIQPLQNVGLRPQFETTEQYVKFTKYWTDRGLKILEDMLQKTSGKYCVGDQLTIADLCLVPQLYNAITRHKLDISKYPTVSKLYHELLKEKVFQETHPEKLKSKM